MRSDAELVKAVLDSDPGSYGALVQRYERAIYGVALGVLGNHHAVEDATQEVLVAGYRKLGSLRKANMFGPWILKIARRSAVHMARRTPIFASIEAASEMAIEDCNVTLNETERNLLTAIMRLPKHERQVAVLRHLNGYQMPMISKATGRPIGTVTKQLSRARQRLQKWLKESEQ